MDTQLLIALLLLAASLGFLGWKYLKPAVAGGPDNDEGCGPDCGCG